MFEFIGYNASDNIFFPLALAFALFMLFLFKEHRLSFVLPSLIILVIIVNPLFRVLWESVLHLPYYWRVLWIPPVIPLCAAFWAALWWTTCCSKAAIGAMCIKKIPAHPCCYGLAQ